MQSLKLVSTASSIGNAEPDVWSLDELDLEPERCCCLRCGAELPCLCSSLPSQTSLAGGAS